MAEARNTFAERDIEYQLESGDQESTTEDEDGVKMVRWSSSFTEQDIQDQVASGDDESTTEDEDESGEETELVPSEVTKKDYIYWPREFENFEAMEKWKCSGKWMIFAKGNLDDLDCMWTWLKPLVEDGTLICIKSSTKTDPDAGVIMCYTSDCEDVGAVKRAADAIRGIVDNDCIMYYKTNEASDTGLYRSSGDTHISKYMHTTACSIYEKDENNRWAKIFT